MGAKIQVHRPFFRNADIIMPVTALLCELSKLTGEGRSRSNKKIE